MIGKVTPRSTRVRGLLHYLFGPGTANEHTNPRVIAGYAPAASLQPPGNLDAGFDVAGLARRLEAAERSLPNGRGPVDNVWHCPLSLPPGERLDDATWARVATRFAEEMGLAETPDRPGCRWVAVHHGASAGGNDHIHFVAVLVRDGDPARPEWLRRDYPRVQRACSAIEAEFGLIQATPGRESGPGRAPTSRAEYRRAARTGKPLDRDVLRRDVRAAAAGSTSEVEFAARLREAGLWVRTRADRPGRVVGYAVALAVPDGAEPRWLSGSKLEPDLGLLRLRKRWDGPHASAAEWADPPRLVPEPPVDADAMWQPLTDVLDEASRRVRTRPPSEEELGAAARAGADLAALLAARVEPRDRFGPLSAAADQLARATANLPGRRASAASGLLHNLSRSLRRYRIGERSDSLLLTVAVAVVHLAATIQALCEARVNAAGAAGLARTRLDATVEGLRQAARDITPDTPQARRRVNTAFTTTTRDAARQGPVVERPYRPPAGPEAPPAER